MKNKKNIFVGLFAAIVLVVALLYLINLPKTVSVELYGTSTHPKTLEIENKLIILKEKFGDKMDFSINLAADKNEKGEFISYNVDPENPSVAQLDIAENTIQVLIKEYYPNQYLEYLTLRNQNIADPDSSKYMRAAGIDPKKIEELLESKEGSELLSTEIDRFNAVQEEYGFDAMPALLINDTEYVGSTEILSLAAALVKPMLRGNAEELTGTGEVSLFGGSITFTLPWKKTSYAGINECYTDLDCNDKLDKNGFCKEKGTEKAYCRYEEPEEVSLTILTDETCVSCHVDKAIELLEKDFKGLTVTTVDLDSDEGKEIIEKYKVRALPLFIFDEDVTKSRAFETYTQSELITKVSDDDPHYILTQSEGRKLFTRPVEENTLHVFVNAHNPLSVALEKELIERKRALEAAGEESFNLSIHHVLLVEEDDEGNVHMIMETPGGIPEIEESVRQIVIEKYYPDKYYDYLLKRAENLERDHEEIMNELGIDPNQVELAAKNEGEALMRENAVLAFDLQVSSLPVFLWENQVIVLSVLDLQKIPFFERVGTTVSNE
ncbi:thioredoxin family protein [Patescibacteria group bacterium]|nr:thioredoxin family protein [Patescibacteria group bacterium]